MAKVRVARGTAEILAFCGWAVSLLVGCSAAPVSGANVEPQFQKSIIQTAFNSGELRMDCNQAVGRFDRNQKLKIQSAYDFDRAWTDLMDATQPLIFMRYVSPDDETRTEASACKAKVRRAIAQAFTNRRLYHLVSTTNVEDMDQERLVVILSRNFERHGATLSAFKLKKLRILELKLNNLVKTYKQNLKSNKSTLTFTGDELAGMSSDFLAAVKSKTQATPATSSKPASPSTTVTATTATVAPTAASNTTSTPTPTYAVPVTRSDFIQVLTDAQSAQTRRAMMPAYENRASENIQILAQAIRVRERIARLLGFKNWAEYRVQENMARDSKNVMATLNELRADFSPLYAKEQAQLLQLKQNLLVNTKPEDQASNQQASNKQASDKPLKSKQSNTSPAAKQPATKQPATKQPTVVLHAWDIRYLTKQLEISDFGLSSNEVRQYFPADTVTSKILSLLSTVFGVRFERVDGAVVWSDGVKLYAIVDPGENSVIGYFYVDLTSQTFAPGHAAAFALIDGREERGGYRLPVSALIANFNGTNQMAPTLLSFSDVRKLLRSFGRLMQQTLTHAPYGYLSGSRVVPDFADTPSQMLEHWLASRMILRKISGFYKNPAKPLPDDLIAKLLAVQKFERDGLPIGYFYMRRIVRAYTDVSLYSSMGAVDPDQVYAQIYKKILGFSPAKGAHFLASFKPIMAGRDGICYSRLWSEIYAADMFSRFQKGGLLNAQVGGDFRTAILEQGNMMNPLNLISTFLGRQPNKDAFLSDLGLQ